MTDPTRIDVLLRAANPVPDQREAMKVVRDTDPLWQSIRSRLASEGDTVGHDLPRAARAEGQEKGMDTATKEGTSRTGRYLAAAAVLLVAVAAFATTRLGDEAEVAPVGEQEGTDGEQGAPAEEPVPAAEAMLSFTFTGEGPDACQYDGPRTITQGQVRSTAQNTAAVDVNVNLDAFAEGYGYEDFLERVGAPDEDFPVVSPAGGNDPAQHAWLASGWRTIHPVPAGATHNQEQLSLFPGEFVVMCFTAGSEPGTSNIWADGTITVLP